MGSRWWRSITSAAIGIMACGRLEAAVLVPMADADLVALSDLVVVATVGEVRSALLEDARVVSRVTLVVEEVLKGVAGAPTVVVTEVGGHVGAIETVVPGAPRYATGERIVAFLTRRADGSLRTTAMALGVYHVTGDPPAVPMALRRRPTLEARPLDVLAGRVRELARDGGSVTDGREGLAVVRPVIETVVSSFTMSSTSPARWFEADCGTPVAFSRANAAEDAGESVSGTAVVDGLAAWTGVAGASLQLGAGPPTVPAPSVVGGTNDGVNAIQYDDPFGEVTDMVGCTGVLARGGYTSAFDEAFTGLSKTVGGVTYGRIFEGDATVNAGAFACLADAAGLAELVGHEVGHAIGFGHSSENPGESDPVLADALMYFRVHDDGRGATLGEDDRAGMATVYPADVVASTPIAAFACHLDLGIFAPPCFAQELVVTPFQRFEKARKAGNAASLALKPGKRRKQLKQAVRFLKKTDKAIAAGIDGACGDAMRATVAERIAEAGAVLATL